MKYDRARLRGLWPFILSQVGIDTKSTEKMAHRPCPVCQAVKFRFTDYRGNGEWICTCGYGDGLALIQEVKGIDFKDALKLACELAGQAEATIPDAELKYWPISKAREMIEGAVLAAPSNIVGDYMATRGITFAGDIWPTDIYYHSAQYHVESADRWPCMVAMVRNRSGEVCYLHRTFLASPGVKAPVDPVRKLTPPFQGLNTSAPCIRLRPCTGDTLGIAEGIETAIAASQIYDIPVWSAVNANWLAKWEIPNGIPVRRVVIFGDNDKSYTGQAAAYKLAHRLTVQRKIETLVMIPASHGDWLDEYNRGKVE